MVNDLTDPSNKISQSLQINLKVGTIDDLGSGTFQMQSGVSVPQSTASRYRTTGIHIDGFAAIA